MAKQTINPGVAPTGAGGDTFRSGSAKLQANDDEIYSQLGATPQGVLPVALPLNKGGTGATTAEGARTNLGLGTAADRNVGETVARDLPSNSVIRKSFGLKHVDRRTLTDFDYNTLTAGEYVLHQASSGQVNPPPAPYMAIFVQRNYLDDNQLTAIGHDYFDGGLSTRGKRSGNWSSWARHYHTLNTTVDANGFIKAASPVVQIFADRIELNDEARQQEISFEKLGIGDYLIKGSSGFAQEGWYVETPKDANGNVLFSVIYTTLENGDISVKTYKKKFNFETVSIVADLENPVDITENRWIDLRLQELPQPEIEMPESIAPPEFQPTGLAEAVAIVMESYNDTEQ